MAKLCPAAPVIPLELLWKGLGHNCFGPANIAILQQDTELPHWQFRAQQIFYIVDWARIHLRIDPKIGSLERAFKCSRHTIHSALANGRNEPKSRGRHSAVSAESDANILAWITGKAEKNAAVTRTDIKNYWRKVCKIEVTREWVNSFISRHSAELIERTSSPQDEPRFQVSRVFLDQNVCIMHKAAQGRPTDLVFHLVLMKSGYPTGKTDNRRR
jgi:transposase